jgi:hypothetical protein
VLISYLPIKAQLNFNLRFLIFFSNKQIKKNEACKLQCLNIFIGSASENLFRPFRRRWTYSVEGICQKNDGLDSQQQKKISDEICSSCNEGAKKWFQLGPGRAQARTRPPGLGSGFYYIKPNARARTGLGFRLSPKA